MSVSLQKRQTISLAKESKGQLKSVQVGLGWDPVKKGGLLGGLFGGSDSIDLDASCAMLALNGDMLDLVWFRQLESKCGSIRHSGDNLTGDGDGDDEVIYIDLTKIPSNVEYLAITVNSFRGQTFNEVQNAFCRVVNDKGVELGRYNLSEQGRHTGVLIASMARNGGDWTFTAHGKACQGRMVQDMLRDILMEIVQ